MNYDLFGDSGATFSPCRVYRYRLWRIWDKTLDKVMFVGLNPSTADETQDDPTIRRCIGYAQKWGYGGLYMGNLFAYRATDPKDMYGVSEPIGDENDRWLEEMSSLCDITIAAWGNHGEYLNRADAALPLLSDVHYLRLNQSGQPAHPLYLPKNLEPIPFLEVQR